MSAIVAKAINDSLGTENFKGLNTIMDEQLNKVVLSLDDFVQNLPPKIEEAIRLSSNTLLSPSQTTIFYNVLLEAGGEQTLSLGGSQEKQIGRTFKFNCNGAITVLLDHSATSGRVTFYAKRNGEQSITLTKGMPGVTIPIVEGDTISFHVKSLLVSGTAIVPISDLKILADVIPNASVDIY